MFEINRKMAFYAQGPDPYIPKILEDIKQIQKEQQEDKKTMQELIRAHNELQNYTYKTAQELIDNVNTLEESRQTLSGDIGQIIKLIPALKSASTGSGTVSGGRSTRRRRRKQ